MDAMTAEQEKAEMAQRGNRSSAGGPRWDLAFIAILGYVVVEYTRLPAMFPILVPLELGKVVVGVALLGWLVSPRKLEGDRSAVWAIDAALVLLLSAAFVSLLFAGHRDLAWSRYVDFLRWGLIYFLLGRIVTGSWRYRIFVLLLLLLNLKLAQHAIRYFYAARAYWGSEAVAVREGAKAGSTGFFANSGDFGLAMCVVWPIAVMLLFAKAGKSLRLFLLACSGVFLVAILVCGSRGAVVGAACSVLAGIMMSRKKLAVILMALLLLPGIVYILPGASKARFQSALRPEGDRTATERMQLWRAGLMMFRDNPIVGVGIANFGPTRLEKYAQPGDTTYGFVPHSIYIEVLSELGLAGMIPFLALVVLFFRLNARSRKILLALGDERRRSYEYCLSLGLDLALIGYLTSGAFIAVFYYPHLWILLGLSTGLYGACCRIQQDATKAEAVPADRTVPFQLVAI